jgi:hypothetical protein
MMPKPNAERLIYVLVLILSLAALALVAVSPTHLVDDKVVYQGF